MVVLTRGAPAPERREGRVRLSVRDPLIESLVAGLGIEGANLDEARAACKVLVRDRNRWDVGRRRGGLFGRRLSPAEASAALANGIAALQEGGGL